MNYKGKLYGKLGNKYFDTGATSDDYDKLNLIFQILPLLTTETINLICEDLFHSNSCLESIPFAFCGSFISKETCIECYKSYFVNLCLTNAPA